MAESRSHAIRNQLIQRAGPTSIVSILRAIHWTSKLEIIGRGNLDRATESGRPVVCAFWHGEIAAMILLRLSVSMPLMVPMLSRSRDGELAAAVARRLGGDPVRGSSSRGASTGLIALQGRLADRAPDGGGLWACMVLDGPRGPRHRAKGGAVHLARRSGALLLPFVSGQARRIALRSWDRTLLPLPFGRTVIVVGEPIDLRDSSGGESLEACESFSTEDLERVMFDLAQTHPLCARDHAVE